jgi:alkylation response protein AidB-like acyl-CoA dehydrogenase
MLLPRALGGEQVELEEALSVTEEFARQDGSVGWNVTFSFISPLFGDYLSEDPARRIYGNGDAVVAASFAPSGRAEPVEGGYRISGQWGFMSGCHHANWIFANCLVFDGDRPLLGPDGAPTPRSFAFPASAGEIIDTWRTAGMRGTGSHDFAVADLIVAEEYSFPTQFLFGGPSPRLGLGQRRPFLEIAPLFLAAVGLGVARDAVDSFTALAATKTPLAATSKLASQSTVHERVGRAEAMLRAARCYLYETAQEVGSTPEGVPPMVLMRRLAAAHAAETATEVVNLMYKAAGGTSIYESSRLERCFRDINTLTHHIQIAPGTFVAAGEWLLDQRINPT